jgi:uncharacterized protein YodC (DUF2158 family)
MATVKIKDVVVLISGGPPMALEEIFLNHDGRLLGRCVWFDGNERREAVFDTEILKSCEEKLPKVA